MTVLNQGAYRSWKVTENTANGCRHFWTMLMFLAFKPFI